MLEGLLNETRLKIGGAQGIRSDLSRRSILGLGYALPRRVTIRIAITASKVIS
jgi:hypothetical protein